MDIKTYELADGRCIGLGATEITAFPDCGQEHNAGDAVAGNARLFRQAVCEFFRLGGDGNTCAELIWLTEPAEKQAFRSRLRVFLVFRRVSVSAAGLEQGLGALSQSFSVFLTSQGYSVAQSDADALSKAVSGVCSDGVYAVVKQETCGGNALSPYPYYYCSVLPGDNRDNFESLISALSESESCCVSFQLFPAALTNAETAFMNEQAAELGRIAGGFITQHQMYRDESAALPRNVLSHYIGNARSPLFQYNILICGAQRTCTELSARVISLLQAGTAKIAGTECGCVDLGREGLRLDKQLALYPWNINKRLIFTYRNTKLLNSLRSANVLYRLPYLMTADEASAFFRLPLYTKGMTAIKSSQSARSIEQFDASVTDENNIKLGTLIANTDREISIGCPERAFTKHMLIVGMPGVGKTTLSVDLLLQFARRGIPFLAIEPTKTEYRAMIDAVEGLRIFTPGNNAVSPFIINPFMPPAGITVEQYIPSLASAFKAAFSMPSPLDVLFLRAIRSCYTKYGWKDYSLQSDPDVTMFGLHEFIMVFKGIIAGSNYSKEVKGNLESGGVFRLMNLIEQNRNIYDTVNSVPIEDILSAPTVIELNSIDNADQKALLMALLLINICLYTKQNQAGDGKLKNIILIDEAHVLLGSHSASASEDADSQATTVSALQNMIAEIRSFGTGIIIADQSPSKVSREVVANTDIKVSFRLVQSSEKALIADSTNMDEASVRRLAQMKTGEAYVYYNKLEAPQLVRTTDIREDMNIRLVVPNAEIAARTDYWKTRRRLLRPYAECRLCSMCREDCDFLLRAQAVYYTDKLYDKNADKVTSSAIMMKYLSQFPALLRNITGDIEGEQLQRLINCIRIQFVRKMEIERSLTLTKKEFAAALKQQES